MNNIIRIIAVSLLYMNMLVQPAMAKGELIKLKGIADSMTLQEKALKKEDANYDKAKTLIESPDIKKGLSQETILERCGAPVVHMNGDSEWIYKPSSSTFFEGEKIYLIFDQNKKLSDWKKVVQE